MNITRRAALALALTAPLVGCTPADDAPEALASTVLAEATEPQQTAAAPSDEAVAAFCGFARDLLLQLMAESPGTNVVCSPVSALFALGLTMQGASGETLAQLETALGLTQAEVLDLCAALLATAPEHEGVRAANAAWVSEQAGAGISPDFLELAARDFSASVYSAPFDATTVADINAWVRNATDDKIERIIEQLPSDSQLALVNALLFKQAWAEPVDAAKLADGETFTAADGSTSEVTMMGLGRQGWRDAPGLYGFAKYYEDGGFQFTGLLTEDEGQPLEDALAPLGDAQLAACFQGRSITDDWYEAGAYLPRFSASLWTSLVDALQALGVTDAFDGGRAQFPGIAEGLFIGQVQHAATIDVDEEGTEAAAATAIAMNSSASATPDQPIVREVRLDRPFFYAVVHADSGVPWFLGANVTGETF